MEALDTWDRGWLVSYVEVSDFDADKILGNAEALGQ